MNRAADLFAAVRAVQAAYDFRELMDKLITQTAADQSTWIAPTPFIPIEWTPVPCPGTRCLLHGQQHQHSG